MNIFLVASETIYFMEEKLKELKKDITNIITFNLDENTIDDVLEEASYFSMFNDEKCIIVKNSKFLGSSKNSDSNKNKEIINKIMKYIDNENKNTKIIFTLYGKPDSKKKLYSILKDVNHVFYYPNITKTEMKNELSNISKANKFKIDDNSLWHIINSTLGNFDLAVNELNKIMMYGINDKAINFEDVKALTSKNIEENNFKLVDSIIDRDLVNSLKLLDDAKILKVEPSVILALLYREFKLMLSFNIYEENKISKNEIMENLKIADWQYNKILNNLRKYRKYEIEEEIIKLGELDYKLKSGLINKDTILINYILDICS